MKNFSLWLISVLALVSCASISGDERARVLKKCPNIAEWEVKSKPRNEYQHLATMPTDREKLALLLAWEARDQEVRAAMGDGGVNQSDIIKRMMEVDADILKGLKQLVADRGYPTRTQVGDEGMRAFWLLVQHAASDTDFQESALNFLKRDANGIDNAELAMLTDQVRVARGQPQIYGTQFRRVNGKFVAYEISEPTTVNRRRAEYGLMPIEDYECVLNATYKSQ